MKNDELESAATGTGTDTTAMDLAVLLLSVLIAGGAFAFGVSDEGRVCIGGRKSLAVPEICWLKRNTGLDCPTCGLTRSFVAASRMDFRRAWQYHRLGPASYLFILFQVLYRAIRIAARRADRPLKPLDRRATLAALFIAAAAFLANWVFNLVAGAV